MLRALIVVPTLSLILLTAEPVTATFHLSRIQEVMSGVAGNAAIQYVEIEMVSSLQASVAGSRLTAFVCDGTSHTILLQVPLNLTNSGPHVRWIMATTDPIGGIHPDFTWDPTTTGSLPTPCGMLCWGAPGIAVPNPSSWDPGDPNNYVDCVGYGGYHGPTKTSAHDGTPMSGTPSNLPPGDGTDSLTRVSDTQSNIADFNAACPSPTNNAGLMGAFGACTPPTTTTVTTSTTTTSLAAAAGGGCGDPHAAAAVRAEIDATCPCSGAANHRAYVKCAAKVATMAVKSRSLPKACKGAVKKCAASSTCGKPGSVTCCRIARGVRKCSVKTSAAACKAPKGGAACVGSTQPSCCDTCAASECPTGATTTTISGGSATTTMPLSDSTTTTSTIGSSCVATGRACTNSAKCCSHYCYLGTCY